MPAFFVAGTYDVLSGARDMRRPPADDGRHLRRARASHFAQMEQPDVVHQLLIEFLDRVS